MKQLTVLLLSLTAVAAADTLLVPSEYPSIQDAISASQSGDTVLVSPGEYGGPISFLGKNIVVRSTNGASETLIRTFSDYHCVSFTNGEDSTAVLEGFTIRNTISDDSHSSTRQMIDHGGGLYVTNSSPTIMNCRLMQCVAETGAGLYLQHSSMRMEDCVVSNNEAWYYGGGLFIGSSDEGKPPCIIDCSVTQNDAQDGGGIYLWGDTVVVINSVVSENEGTGIEVNDTGILLASNLLSSNTGCGISLDGGNATLIGNIIAKNEGLIGAGIYCTSLGYLRIQNNTVFQNIAMGEPYGTGGIRITFTDSAYINNSIVISNEAPNGIVPNILVYESFLDISYSNIGYGTDSIWIDSTSTLIWGPGNIDVDPLFETGPICDYHLSMDSPCIDAGNPSPEYNDPEDPFNPGYALWPAMGYLRNDMGAFGGGSVGYWLSVEEEEQVSTSEEESSLICYPNPSNGSVSIMTSPALNGEAEICIYDISGKLVMRFTDLETNIVLWDCDDDSGREVPSGIYLIQGISGDQSLSVRVVKL
jgi:hypothetical protein